MDNGFGETLRRLRTEAGLTQSQVAQQLYVTRSAVARWESGTRLPDAAMVSRLAACLGVEADRLLNPVTREGGAVNVIVVDDERIVLAHELPVIRQALPAAKISGFQRPSEALEYARRNLHELGAKAELRHGDLFAAVGREKFDIIVSNPPYIPRSELIQLQREVRYEPQLALDGAGCGDYGCGI